MTQIFNKQQIEKAKLLQTTDTQICRIQQVLKMCAMANEAKASLFELKWNRMSFGLTMYGQSAKDKFVQSFSTEVMKVSKQIIQGVAKMFIKRSKMKHTIAFCQWRRDYKSKKIQIGKANKEQMSNMISANIEYFNQMNELSNQVLKDYSTESINYEQQKEFIFDINHLE